MGQRVRLTSVTYADQNHIEVWLNEKRIFNSPIDAALSNTPEARVMAAEAIVSTLVALGHTIKYETCKWDDTTDLAAPFRVVDPDGDEFTDDIETFDDAVGHCGVQGIGFEVVNRFGNSVYRCEEE